MVTERRIVMGDIHGCELTFREMIFGCLKIKKFDTIYLLGDYIDRGPRIKETVDLIIELISTGYNIQTLLGNHERMLLDSLESPEDERAWFNNGGHTTLDAFNCKSAKELDTVYLNFIKQLKYFFMLDDFVITHAGLNFNIDDPMQDKDAMLWNRDYFVDKNKIGGRRLISGHTPHTLEQIKYYKNSDKIQLDGGCVYYNKYRGLGYLCAVELNSMELSAVLNKDY